MSWREVITSFAVSSPKRIMPCNILCSSLMSLLSVSSSACSKSSIDNCLFSFCKTFSAKAPLFKRIVSIGQNNLRKNITPFTALRQKASGFVLPYTLGIISPKSNNKKVNRIVTQRNCNHSALNVSKLMRI